MSGLTEACKHQNNNLVYIYIPTLVYKTYSRVLKAKNAVLKEEIYHKLFYIWILRFLSCSILIQKNYIYLHSWKYQVKENNFPEPEFSFSRNGGACFLVENSSTRQKVLQLLLHAFSYRQVAHSHLQTKAPAHVRAVGLSHKSVIHNTYTVT